MRLFLVLSLAAAAALTACSSEDATDTNDGGLKGSEAGAEPAAGTSSFPITEAYCAGYVAHDQVCPSNQGATPTVQEACVAENAACVEKLFRLDAVQLFAACHSQAKGCGTEDEVYEDECVAEAGAKMPANPVYDAYLLACQGKLTTCAAGSFSNDWCSVGDVSHELYTDAILQRYESCFDKPCDEIGTCLRSISDSICPREE